MLEFLHSVASVLLILLLTALGYGMTALGWLKPEAKSFLSRFLLRIIVPCYCIYGLRTHLTRDAVLAAGAFLAVPLISSLLLIGLSVLAGRLLKLPRRSLGVFIALCSVSNAFFIGYPMCTELFGEAAVPHVILYFLINTIFLQMVMMPLIRWAGEAARDAQGTDPASPTDAKTPGRSSAFLSSLARVFTTPSVIGVLLGLLILFLDIQLPDIVMSFLRYMNNLVTPLALVLAGCIIHEIGLHHLKIDRVMIAVLLFRFLLGPVSSFLLIRLFGVEGLGASVILVEASMPVATQTVAAATEYGADESLAARAVAVTTLATFIDIPLLMFLIPH